MARSNRCVVCETTIGPGEAIVLVRRKIEHVHCSEICLERNVDREQRARAAARRRWLVRGSVAALVLLAGPILWHRFRAQPRQSISYAWPEELPRDPRPEPIYFGPVWPPTDADWMYAFDHSSWTYPLPGPIRRAPIVDAQIFGPELPGGHPAVCREAGRCGVDLGGELWGEHVYAAQDGIVERVRGSARQDGGGEYVRLSHFGGMVFTQYFHLAAIPRRLVRGAHVKAGDLIGLVGDTGLEGSRRHLSFALSVRPSAEFPETYWDPSLLMADWPLRLPAHGTVAGFVPVARAPEPPPRRRTQ